MSVLSGSCLLAEFTGVDEGGCRTFQGLKVQFWYLLARSASNESQGKLSQYFLWAEKENVRRYLTHLQSSL